MTCGITCIITDFAHNDKVITMLLYIITKVEE